MKQMKHCNKNEKILNRKTGKHNEKRMEKIKKKSLKKLISPKKLYTIATPPIISTNPELFWKNFTQ